MRGLERMKKLLIALGGGLGLILLLAVAAIYNGMQGSECPPPKARERIP